jgi:hypothetical protein
VNNVTVLSDSGIDTRAAANDYYNIARIGVTGAGNTKVDFDDLYIRNDSTFLGSWRIQTQFPTSNDSVTCTPSAGDNFAAVDDNPADDDTTYVEGGDTDVDDYNHSFDADTVTTVHGVMVNTICRETDATPFDIKQRANDNDSAGEAIGGTSYVHRGAIFETNPDTSLAWTPAEVAAATFGFKIESGS